jgi:hypothetical protein
MTLLKPAKNIISAHQSTSRQLQRKERSTKSLNFISMVSEVLARFRAAMRERRDRHTGFLFWPMEPQPAQNGGDVNGNANDVVNGDANDDANGDANAADEPEEELEEELEVLPASRKIRLKLDGWIDHTIDREQEQTGGAGSFHLFRDLPFELRQKIWRTSMERFRVVTIENYRPDVEKTKGINQFGKPSTGIHWISRNRLPAVFSICQESRLEAVQFYRIELPFPDWRRDMPLQNRSPVHVNPDWDFVMFRVNKDEWQIPIEAYLCHDLMAYDPKCVGVRHFGRKDSWTTTFGEFEPPKAPEFPASEVLPLKESTKNLLSWTETVELHVRGELQHRGRYEFPHWWKRDGYFTLDTDLVRKAAYVVIGTHMQEDYESVLSMLNKMIARTIDPEVSNQLIIQLFHITPISRDPDHMGLLGGQVDSDEEALIIVGQVRKEGNAISFGEA